MAILEVKDLIRAVSRDDALEDIIVLAQSMKLRARSWRIGSKSRFWIVALAEVASRVSVQVALQTAGGFNETAWGNMLTKFSKSRFDNERVRAIKTQGGAVLTDEGGNGPYTIVAGAYVFTFDDDPSITYRNITGGVLAASGTLAVTLEAETGGEDSNVDVDKITAMNPTIAGVTVTNPAAPTDWITRFGVNIEPDPTLQVRNAGKWATLGGNAPYTAYDFWALSATENADGTGDPVGITRSRVDDQNPAGPGTIYIYIADDAGTASGAQVIDVQDYIMVRKPRTAIPTTIAAAPALQTVAGTFRCAAGRGATAKAEIEAAIADYINSLPIGGEDIGETLGVVVWSELIEIAKGIDGVLRVALTTPTGDVSLQPYDVATVSSITFTAQEI